MTLVTIDLGDVAGGHDPDDYVTIRAEAFREAVGGGITSTAEVKIPLVDGVGQAEVEPGPVVVSFRCQAVADTREKRGVVPETGPVGIEDVIGGAFEYTPPVVNRGLDLIEGARDEALGQVAGAVSAEAEAIRWWRGYLNADSVITTLPQGMYGVATTSVATALGLPIAATGWLMVYWGLSSGLVRRVDYHTHFSSTPVIYTMRLLGGEWTSWEISSHLAPALGSGADLDDARAPARYAVVSTGVANLPSQRPGSVDVAGTSGGVIQTYTDLDLDVYVRRTGITGAWTPWSQLNAVVDPTVPDDVAQARAEAIAAIIAAQSEALEAIRNAPGGGGGFVDRGTWSTSEDYVIGDVVTHDGGRWVGQPHVSTQVRKNYVGNPGILPSPQGALRPRWSIPPYISAPVATPGRIEMTVTQNLAEDSVLLTNSERTPTTPGEVASAAVVISVPADSPAVTVTLRILYYSSPPGGTVETIQPGQSKRLIFEGSVTPANRSEMSLYLSIMGPVGAGSKIVVSEPILEKSPTIGNYFDGDSPDSDNGSVVTHEWEGDPWEGGATQTRITTTNPDGVPGVDPAWVLLGGAGAGGGIDADALEQLRAASAAVEATREYVDTRMSELDVAFTDSVPPYLQQPSLDVTYGERAEEALPLKEVTITPRGSDPIPTEFFDGFIWGVDNDVIRQSSDGGQSWLTVGQATGIGNIQRILKCDDGELLVVSTTAAWRSVGWGTESVSWQVILENPTPSYFYPWGISGDGTKFIITHYSGSGVATPDRADSRYTWISTDGGKAFSVKWDTAQIFGEEINELTHIHAVEYDPWEDRFFIAEGHVSATGVYVSYDDGDTWDKVDYGVSFNEGYTPGNSPTVIKATDHGIVFGTDDPTNGLLVMPRGSNTIDRVYSRMGVSNTTLFGYAHMGARDPRTGMVYTVWEMNQVSAGDLGAQIMASDGLVGGDVWEDTDPARYLWRRIVVDDQGNLLAWEQTTNAILRARAGERGAKPGHVHDSGRVLGGQVLGGRTSLAVGAEANAQGNRSIAVGGGASTSGHNGTAVGADTTVTLSGTALGVNAAADSSGVSVGYQSVGRNGTAVGAGAIVRNVGATAIGRGAVVETTSGGAVLDGTAIGRDAAVRASKGSAVGRSAVVEHANSVALGEAVVTSAANQVAVGARDIEIQSTTHGVVLRSPNGSRWRISIGDDGVITAMPVG